jgi:hypothetical protein
MYEPEEYPYCFTYLAAQKAAGAKARQETRAYGTASQVAEKLDTPRRMWMSSTEEMR